jgi:hypothetical protein
MFVDNENTFYASSADGKIHAYGLIGPANPSAGIKVQRTLDFNDTLKKVAESGSAALKQYGARIVGVNATYDGKRLILTNRSIAGTRSRD